MLEEEKERGEGCGGRGKERRRERESERVKQRGVGGSRRGGTTGTNGPRPRKRRRSAQVRFPRAIRCCFTRQREESAARARRYLKARLHSGQSARGKHADHPLSFSPSATLSLSLLVFFLRLLCASSFVPVQFTRSPFFQFTCRLGSLLLLCHSDDVVTSRSCSRW